MTRKLYKDLILLGKIIINYKLKKYNFIEKIKKNSLKDTLKNTNINKK